MENLMNIIKSKRGVKIIITWLKLRPLPHWLLQEFLDLFIYYAPHTPSINILQPDLLYITKKDIN